MIYTIGNRDIYLRFLFQYGEDFFKVGSRNDYPGGYAFQSVEDAERCISERHYNSDYMVFGLLADWEDDTIPDPGGYWWHVLKNDARIVLLPDMET